MYGVRSRAHKESQFDSSSDESPSLTSRSRFGLAACQVAINEGPWRETYKRWEILIVFVRSYVISESVRTAIRHPVLKSVSSLIGLYGVLRVSFELVSYRVSV